MIPFSILFVLVSFCLWGCSEDEEVIGPLRKSDRTVINTRPPSFVTVDSAALSAEILETGPLPIIEAGFLLSQDPQPTPETGTFIKVSEGAKAGPYSIVAKNLDANKKYYYRFYAKDKEQVLWGSIQSFTTSGIAISRVSYGDVADAADFYEAGAGNNMMIQGTNFSRKASENIVKIGNIVVPVTSVFVFNELEQATVLSFTIPEHITPGNYEISVTRAGQTVKASELLRILPGKWKRLQNTNMSMLAGRPTYSASAFALDGKGYVAGLLPYLPVSLYQYTADPESWTKLKITIDTYHTFLTAFGLNSKIYAGVAAPNYNNTTQFRYEVKLHAVDPVTGAQEQKQPMPAGYPTSSVTITRFTIGDKAYMGGGNYAIDSWGNRVARKDFYQYTPAIDNWTRISDFPGKSTTNAITFEINGTAYLVAPTHDNKVLPEVWAYESGTNTWTRKRDFPGQLKTSMTGYAIGSAGYVIGGTVNPYSYSYNGPDKRDFWKYDPATDTWQEVASFDGNNSTGIVSFAMHGKAYVVYQPSQYSNTSIVWEYTPAP
ncbi:IPT/TIG domain-containing protein [Pontibacter sp. BT310]|uniref:IPT/TIG domain-containing protein n=1 Tax=Pontibacter TaxID=323449 RepID=UPI0018EBDEA5|nr:MULTISPECIES: IPT/TIG domain-containing protein [Pontibacter]MBJ6116890.1 IPT/TIG domain-containing protein [Pontibacter sp. BT310]